MQDFDSLKNMWQQPAGTPEARPDMTTIINHTTTSKMKLQKSQLHGAIMLSLTAVFIISLAVFGNLHFTHWYTYGGMALIALICTIQAAFMYITFRKIKSIDETVEPVAHLRQWEAYYDLIKNQNRWNMPVYYIALNIAMAIYMVEVFTGRPLMNVLIFVAVYAAWMLFAYFYLGKKNIKREDRRLQKIINELKTVEGQLSKAE